MSVATARSCQVPSATAVVTQEQEYGATSSVQTVVQVPDPSGARWMTTEATDERASVAVAPSVTVPESGLPGSVIATVGGVQSLAAVTDTGAALVAVYAAVENCVPVTATAPRSVATTRSSRRWGAMGQEPAPSSEERVAATRWSGTSTAEADDAADGLRRTAPQQLDEAGQRDDRGGHADEQHPGGPVTERDEEVAHVGQRGGDPRLGRGGQLEGPRVGVGVGVALGPEGGAVDRDDPVRHQGVDAGVGRRDVGDHVADLEVRDRDALLEHDRAEVVGALHRAAGDDVALEAERGREQEGQGEDHHEQAQAVDGPAAGTGPARLLDDDLHGTAPT